VPAVAVIYHLAQEADWRAAEAVGEYHVSTRGRTLAEVGFIHCSDAGQVAAVANRIYSGVTDLVLLAIDPALLHAEVRYEAAPGSAETFPHVYGPLNMDAVVLVVPFPPDADGTYTFEEPAGPVA
jgi:glutathione S-transferase